MPTTQQQWAGLVLSLHLSFERQRGEAGFGLSPLTALPSEAKGHHLTSQETSPPLSREQPNASGPWVPVPDAELFLQLLEQFGGVPF